MFTIDGIGQGETYLFPSVIVVFCIAEKCGIPDLYSVCCAMCSEYNNMITMLRFQFASHGFCSHVSLQVLAFLVAGYNDLISSRDIWLIRSLVFLFPCIS